MSNVHCTYCGKDHPVELCPHTYGGSVARNQLRCNYCGATTHTATFCEHTAAGHGNRRADLVARSWIDLVRLRGIDRGGAG